MTVKDDHLTEGPDAGLGAPPAERHRQSPAHRLRDDAKVLPEQARVHNRALLLRRLYQEGSQSRADLARRTGLTRVSVSDVVSGLVEDGFVTEVGIRSESRPGKPAMLLEFNTAAAHVIGLDLSHSTLYRGALLDLGGEVLARRDVEIDASEGAEALTKVVGLVATLREEATAPLLGIGVGTPGVVDPAGVVLDAPSLGWVDLDLRSILMADFGCPVMVANDANAAVLAERSFGRSSADTILIRVGVSVGTGLLLGGAPVIGSRFAAGEIGHVIVDEATDRQCACGKVGCLETWLSTRRLHQDLSAARDDGGRRSVLAHAGEVLGAALAPVVAALNVAEIVLSGPHRVLEGPLATAAIQTIRRRGLTPVHGEVTLRLSELGDDIVIRGATAMVMSEQLGIM